MQTQFWTQRDILARGWTKGLLDKWLGDPDELRPNPHQPDNAPMKLYDCERVVGCEFIDGWCEQMAKIEAQRDVRKAGAKKAKETRLRRRYENPVKTFGFGGGP